MKIPSSAVLRIASICVSDRSIRGYETCRPLRKPSALMPSVDSLPLLHDRRGVQRGGTGVMLLPGLLGCRHPCVRAAADPDAGWCTCSADEVCWKRLTPYRFGSMATVFMTPFPVRHPRGGLKPCQSAVLRPLLFDTSDQRRGTELNCRMRYRVLRSTSHLARGRPSVLSTAELDAPLPEPGEQSYVSYGYNARVG